LAVKAAKAAMEVLTSSTLRLAVKATKMAEATPNPVLTPEAAARSNMLRPAGRVIKTGNIMV
jgi:hypothetical protein